MLKRVIMFGLLILIITIMSFSCISAEKVGDVDSDSNAENRTAYESPIPESKKKSEDAYLLSSNFIIIIGIAIAGVFGCAIVLVLWAIRKDRQNSAYAAMANSGATSKPTGLNNKATALTASSEIDSGSEYNFPYPSDFDRPGQKPNHNHFPETQLNEYTDIRQFQSNYNHYQNQYQDQMNFNGPDTPHQ